MDNTSTKAFLAGSSYMYSTESGSWTQLPPPIKVKGVKGDEKSLSVACGVIRDENAVATKIISLFDKVGTLLVPQDTLQEYDLAKKEWRAIYQRLALSCKLHTTRGVFL